MARRLIKIAKELNVGTSTIVDYLSEMGFDIDNKPTAKVTDAMYEELLKEFQSSLSLKEKADSLVIGTRPSSEKANSYVKRIKPAVEKVKISFSPNPPKKVTFVPVPKTKLKNKEENIREMKERIKEAKMYDFLSVNLSNLGLTDFPSELFSISKSIRHIDLSRNYIHSLPVDIDKFVILENLDLTDNEIETIPSTTKNLSEHCIINLEQNKFDIHEEIYLQESYEIIDYILRGQQEKQRPLREAKLIFIGSGGVGKTSLIKKILGKEFDDSESKTDGIEITPWTFESKSNTKIKLNIWDFGGQEIMHATHKFFITSRSLYVLVINPRLEDKYGDREIQYWLKLIRSYADKDVPVIIVINKSDLHDLDVGEGFIKDNFPNVIGFVRTSCAENKGINILRGKIKNAIRKLEHIDQSLPYSYHEVKNVLEKTNTDYIQYHEYEDICNRVNPDFSESERELLMKLLNDLGIMLNFMEDQPLMDTQVLNPEWVTKGVYQIITSPKIIGKKGVLSFKNIKDILDINLYPTDKERYYILSMMDHFELMYKSEDINKYFIPGAFPKDKPNLEIIKHHEKKGVLSFIYEYDILPNSIISRLITKLNHWIYRQNIWRNGCVIFWEQCYASIDANPIKNTLNISIVGKGNKRALLAILREKLETIHSSFAGLKIERYIPFDKDNWISYEDLIVYEEEGMEYYFITSIRKKVSVKKLLSGVNVGTTDKAYIEKLIVENKLDEAITIIKKSSNSNDISVIQSAYNRAQQEKRQGIIDEEIFNRRMNILIKSLLELVDIIE